MKTLLSLVLSGVAIIALSGCGSSGGSDDIIDPGTTNPGTTNPGTTDPGTTNPGTTSGFTPELLVGKTYVIIDGDEEETVSFTETEISFSGNGETGTLPYSIDANGVLIVHDSEEDIIVTLTGIAEGGNLNVDDEGTPTVWVLM